VHTKYVVKALQDMVPALARASFRTIRSDNSQEGFVNLEQSLRVRF